MLRNYFTVAVRALAKNRAYAAINILGLAIGMAACLMILIYVRYELSYDRFFADAERSYQFQTFATDPARGDSKIQSAPHAAIPALQKDFPEIETIAYVTATRPVVLKDGEPTLVSIYAADPGFFDIFPVAFLKGDARAALADINSVAVSARQADRLFGRQDAMGRTITMIDRGQKRDLTVRAVFADLPKNSHQDFSIVRRFDPGMYEGGDAQALTQWGWLSGWVYLKLKPGTDPQSIEQRLPAWQERNVPKENIGGQLERQDQGFVYHLTALPAVHLGAAQQGAARPGNDRGTIITFGVVALLILGMACVNFTNLATARASQRAREVALRKVLGASRRQIMAQFLAEAVLVAALAMVLALTLVEISLPWFARFLDADLALHYFGHDGALLPIVLLTLVVGLAAGAYPAFALSGFQPARVLKANKSASAEGTGRLRNMLVVAQFAVSIGLIICTAVIYSQTLYAKQADPGFKRDGLIQIENMTRGQVKPVARTFEDEVRRLPGVVSASLTGIGVDSNNRSNNGVMMPGATRVMNLGSYPVQPGFFETMGLRLIAGRTLSDRVALDDVSQSATPEEERALVARGMNVVVSRAAATRMGFATPEEAIGKGFRYSAVSAENGLVPATIVGVVEDARYRSIREAVDPIIYFHDDSRLSYLEVRYSSGDPAAVRSAIEATWKRLLPEVPFVADFGDARAARLYKADEARALIFAGFALLAVVVGCLGLFGLAAFTAERRTREIGIRKVLGARTRDIVRLLVWQFSRPVLIANLIAWPIAWWVMRDWLNGFDTRVALGPVPFLAAGTLALGIAVATISGHAYRVARSNPIRALRYE